MTDHLAAARAYLDHLEACNHGSQLSSAVAHILDHLEAQQTAASIRRGLDDVAAGRTEQLGRFTDDEPEPEPEPDPLDNSNHADRIDCVGGRWVWCDDCDGFLMDHAVHKSGIGRSAFWIDERYGPVTFAPRPADTPATAPQPDEAHGDAPDPARPAETHTTRVVISGGDPEPVTWHGDLDNIRAEAWDEGWRTGYADGAHYDDPRITPNPYRKDQA